MIKYDRIIVGTLIGLFSTAVVLSAIHQFQPNGGKTPQTNIQWKQKKGIAVILLDGPIAYSSGKGLYNKNIDHKIDYIRRIAKNKSIKALLIRVNSPGGTVGASQELFQAIQYFKQQTQQPVVVSVADICASGAYWVAAGADYIFANPGSLIGSIGVIMHQLDLTDVKKRYGIGMRTIKSGQYKDLLSSWRDPTNQEKQLVQGMMDDVHQQFKTQVKYKRKMTTKQIEMLAQGQIFTGKQAVKYGLIDQVGGFQDAITYTETQAGLPKDSPLIYQKEKSMQQLLSQLGLRSMAPWTLLQL